MPNKIINMDVEFETCECCGKDSIMELNTHDDDGNAVCSTCMTLSLLDTIKELKIVLTTTSKSLATYGKHPIIEKAIKYALNL